MELQTVTYDPSIASTLAIKAQAALTSAGDIIIDSPEMLVIAGEELREIKTMQKTVEAQRVAITGPLNAALKAVNDLFRPPAEFLVKAEASVKQSVLTYTVEQERIAAAARRAAEIAAQAERLRLAGIAAAAAKAQHDAQVAAQVAAEAAQAASLAGDAAAAEAATTEMMAQTAAAEEAQDAQQEAAFTAEVMTFTPAVAAPAKVAGISSRVSYSAKVTDLMELIKAVAAGTAPIQCLMADEKFLGSQARAFKSPGALYPGVMCNAERALSARAA